MRAVSTFAHTNHGVRAFGAMALGIGILTASSYVAVPMVPVPMTMQTLAVTLIGAVLGWRQGAATVMAWLALAAAGAPVLANGGFGLAPFVGPTAGYLFAFPVAAALTGWMAKDRGFWMVLLAMLSGNALCLGGAAWLAIMIGFKAAMAIGVAPFVAGALVKSGIGAVILKLMKRA